MSKEEALHYLELRKIDKEQAARIYELAGGRMVCLKHMADEIEGKGEFKGMYTIYHTETGLVLTAFIAIRRTMFSNSRRQLMSAGIFPKGRYHKDGAKIVRELLKKGSISDETYYRLIGRDTGNKLLETNVFAVGYYSSEVTFKSTAMRRVCEGHSALWEENE